MKKLDKNEYVGTAASNGPAVAPLLMMVMKCGALTE
jgi:hypothetical protein